jgi:hypothetical protein
LRACGQEGNRRRWIDYDVDEKRRLDIGGVETAVGLFKKL